MVKQYRKKPVVIEAVLLSDDKASEVLDWINNNLTNNGEQRANLVRVYGYITIVTLEGIMRADYGDYVIKGVKGEFYPCKPDIFKATYEAVTPTSGESI